MSDTGKTKTRRRRKQASQGKDRKRKLAKEGTTRRFPIDPSEEAQPQSTDSVS